MASRKRKETRKQSYLSRKERKRSNYAYEIVELSFLGIPLPITLDDGYQKETIKGKESCKKKLHSGTRRKKYNFLKMEAKKSENEISKRKWFLSNPMKESFFSRISFRLKR